MASPSADISYQRLKQEILSDNEGETKRSWKNSRPRRVRVARKVRVKIPRCKNLLGRKISLVKLVWSKICKRMKESQSNFGDLFAGNYLFTQVTPTPFKYSSHAFLGYYNQFFMLDIPSLAAASFIFFGVCFVVEYVVVCIL